MLNSLVSSTRRCFVVFGWTDSHLSLSCISYNRNSLRWYMMKISIQWLLPGEYYWTKEIIYLSQVGWFLYQPAKLKFLNENMWHFKCKWLSKNIHVKSTGNTKLFVGVTVSTNSCLSQCGPRMSWPLVSDVTLPSPYGSWESLQQTSGPLSSVTSGYEKWMNELMFLIALNCFLYVSQGTQRIDTTTSKNGLNMKSFACLCPRMAQQAVRFRGPSPVPVPAPAPTSAPAPAQTPVLRGPPPLLRPPPPPFGIMRGPPPRPPFARPPFDPSMPPIPPPGGIPPPMGPPHLQVTVTVLLH